MKHPPIKVQAFLAKARQRPELQNVNTTFRASSQQLFVDLDRNKAEVLGVPVSIPHVRP